MTLASILFLTLMLALEVAALLFLGLYIWRTPAWTTTLKSLTVAQLADWMDTATLPPAGSSDGKALARLQQIDGRVGVTFTRTGDDTPSVHQLVHGGPGIMPPPGPRKRTKSDWVRY